MKYRQNSVCKNPDPASIAEAIEIITTVSRDAVKVMVHDGWVTLTGTVEGFNQKQTVEQVVRHLQGVRGITNSLSVEPAVEQEAA